jgi:hypothetical protein
MSPRTPACVFVSIFVLSSAFAAGERNTFDPRQFSTGKFHDCPPEGHARRFDPYLDALKNRDIPPPKMLRQRYTVPQSINALPSRLPQTKFNRSRWSTTHQDTAAIWERLGVTIEGYLLGVTREREEACNCRSSTYVDHHLWLAAPHQHRRQHRWSLRCRPDLGDPRKLERREDIPAGHKRKREGSGHWVVNVGLRAQGTTT